MIDPFSFPALAIPIAGVVILLIAGVLCFFRLRAERKVEAERDKAIARRIERAKMEAAGINVQPLLRADGTHAGVQVVGAGGGGARPTLFADYLEREAPKWAQTGKIAPKSKKKRGGNRAKITKAKA
jgi:hypothetical protein